MQDEVGAGGEGAGEQDSNQGEEDSNKHAKVDIGPALPPPPSAAEPAGGQEPAGGAEGAGPPPAAAPDAAPPAPACTLSSLMASQVPKYSTPNSKPYAMYPNL